MIQVSRLFALLPPHRRGVAVITTVLSVGLIVIAAVVWLL
jgi:hypothetical protein